MQRSMIIYTMWILLLSIMVGVMSNSENMDLLWALFLSQYLATQVIFYALSAFALFGIYERPLVQTNAMTIFRRTYKPLFDLITGIMFLTVYDGKNFYYDLADGEFFVIEMLAYCVMIHLIFQVVFGCFSLIVISIQICTCKFDPCACCYKNPNSRRRRRNRNRNQAAAQFESVLA